MRKIIKFSVIIIISLVLVTRIYYINHTAEKLDIITFEKGQTVQIGNNFFERSEEMMDGYSVKVLDSEIVPADKYLDQFGHTLEEQFYSDLDYYYLVTVLIKNENNKFVGEKGIDFRQWYLQGDDYILRVEEFAYSLANPTVGESRSISLNEDSEMQFTLPFYVFSNIYTPYEKLIKVPPELVVALYPEKIMIKL